MKYSVSPVVRVAVKPKNSADLPKLVAGMQRLAKSDPLVQCINDEETGENIIAGSGELHVEICINDLKNEFAQIEILISDPVVSYRETIKSKSSQTALAKSANNQNRLFCTAEPLEDKLVMDIENGDIPMRDVKQRTKILAEKHGFDKNDANKIWGFGPFGEGPNMLFDLTQGC
jgi:elongation factor 2